MASVASRVALLAEGVDRNNIKTVDLPVTKGVALLAEGVDRNSVCGSKALASELSPSSRRAWIEIPKQTAADTKKLVALLAEGVDRNTESTTSGSRSRVALLAEGVDRNW